MSRRLAMVVLALNLIACGTLGSRKSDTPVARGHDIARRVCAACHAVETGEAASPARRAAPFASLEMRHTAGLDGRLAELTGKGHYSMPPLTLTARDLTDLRAYIANLHSR